MSEEAHKETVFPGTILHYGLGDREDMEKGLLSMRYVSRPEELVRGGCGLRSRN